MSGVFSSWAAKDSAAASLVAEAAGYASVIDLSDDEQVLRWARAYLPRIVEHSAFDVETSTAAALNIAHAAAADTLARVRDEGAAS